MLQEVGYHDNVVQLIGICIIKSKGALVLEYAENRDLDELLTHHLHEHPTVIQWPRRTKMASDVAQGMKFLHQELIIHLDLKTSNVLVGKDYRCKVLIYTSSCTPFNLIV